MREPFPTRGTPGPHSSDVSETVGGIRSRCPMELVQRWQPRWRPWRLAGASPRVAGMGLNFRGKRNQPPHPATRSAKRCTTQRTLSTVGRLASALTYALAVVWWLKRLAPGDWRESPVC
jgi:hypothetical protein